MYFVLFQMFFAVRFIRLWFFLFVCTCAPSAKNSLKNTKG